MAASGRDPHRPGIAIPGPPPGWEPHPDGHLSSVEPPVKSDNSPSLEPPRDGPLVPPPASNGGQLRRAKALVDEPPGRPAFPMVDSRKDQPLAPMEAKAAIARITTLPPPEEQEEELTEKATRLAPPWLISLVVHMLLLIILAVLWIVPPSSPEVLLVVKTNVEDEEGEQLVFDTPLGVDDVEEFEEPIITTPDLLEVEDPFAAPEMLEMRPDGFMATSEVQSAQIGMALQGRQEGSKRTLLGRYGGTGGTEEAVLRGLQWLSRNQIRNGRDTGSWSLAGPFRDGVRSDFDNPAAATAMALLAFQGAGHTHKEGKFRRNVALGWRWLLDQQGSDGCFFQDGMMTHRFYTQGQCTIAVCELLAMTQDPKYQKPAERAVEYLLRTQSGEGGWRYHPNNDSDVSVTGWVVMALQSARMAGIEVPGEHFQRVEQFLDGAAHQNGSRYGYRQGYEATLPMTAEALLCRQYLGWARDDPRLVDGVEWLTQPENLIDYQNNRDLYYWYYATQVAHHMEGDYWRRWNAVMREKVPDAQVTHGAESGSWDPDLRDRFEVHGGRLYVTCLSLYMLEVYYRHLPLYTNIYLPAGGGQ